MQKPAHALIGEELARETASAAYM